MNSISFSEKESSRFGINIYRGEIDYIDTLELKNLINIYKVDILILRIPVSSESSSYQLNSMGFNCIHADSLVTHSVDLQERNIPAISKELRFDLITKENCHFLKEMIPVIFKDYRNHYSANPVLEKKKITEGYIEWANTHINNAANCISWYVIKNNNIVGFANCSFDNTTKKSQIVLNGTMPGFKGQKIYTYLVRHMQNHFRSLGFKSMSISSQLQNYPVQRVWAREGFLMEIAHDTYHINTFLSNPQANTIKH
jgi:hypothetical protein